MRKSVESIYVSEIKHNQHCVAVCSVAALPTRYPECAILVRLVGERLVHLLKVASNIFGAGGEHPKRVVEANCEVEYDHRVRRWNVAEAAANLRRELHRSFAGYDVLHVIGRNDLASLEGRRYEAVNDKDDGGRHGDAKR